VSSLLGLSHLCVGCTGFMDIIPEALAPHGYATHFSHHAMPNPPAKKGLVRRWTDLHDMRLLAGAGLPSIEILHHGDDAGPGPSNYRPLLPIADASDATRDVLAQVGVRLAGAPGGLVVECGYNDFDRAVTFWTEGMGFSPKNGDGALLGLRSISPTWCVDLSLVPAEGECEPTYLDDLGCSCLSFLVRDMSGMLEKCHRHGASEIGEIFPLDAGGKALDVVFLRGPHHEMVELIQFA